MEEEEEEEEEAAKTTDGTSNIGAKKQSLKQRNKNISTLPSKCHAGAQWLTTAAKSNTVHNMLLLFLRAQNKTNNG